MLHIKNILKIELIKKQRSKKRKNVERRNKISLLWFIYTSVWVNQQVYVRVRCTVCATNSNRRIKRMKTEQVHWFHFYTQSKFILFFLSWLLRVFLRSFFVFSAFKIIRNTWYSQARPFISHSSILNDFNIGKIIASAFQFIE